MRMNMAFHFNNPTSLIFGSGTLNELGKQKLPGKKGAAVDFQRKTHAGKRIF